LNSEEAHDGANDALVNEVKEESKSDAGKVNLSWRDLPSIFRFLIEVSNETCSLLNSTAVGFLLGSHVNQYLRDGSPLSTQRGGQIHWKITLLPHPGW
jgi:hypothetical protein